MFFKSIHTIYTNYGQFGNTMLQSDHNLMGQQHDNRTQIFRN